MSDQIKRPDLRVPLACYGDDRDSLAPISTLKGGDLYYMPSGLPIWIPAMPGTPWTEVKCHVKMVDIEDLENLDVKNNPGGHADLAVRNAALIETNGEGHDLSVWVYMGGRLLVAMMVRGELTRIESGDWLNR